MADNNKKIVYTINIESKSGEINVKNLTKQIKGLDAEINKVRVSTNEYAKASQGMIDKTGLAGATMIELGRTISDLPYGIRGIANNLSQLSTLFITLITTSGGFKQGIDALLKTFSGPLGIIIVFQAVIALLDHLATNVSRTKEEVSGMATSVASAGSDLKILRDIVNENVVSQDELQRAVEEANKKYKDLNISIDENGKLTEESVRQINNKISALERLAKATAVQKEIEDVYAEIIKSQVAEQNQLLEAEENKYADRLIRITSAGEARVKSEEELTEALTKKQDEIKKIFKKERDDLEKQLVVLRAIIGKEGLLSELFFGKEGAGKKRAKEKLLGFKKGFEGIFQDIDKEGNRIFVRRSEDVKNIYKTVAESGKEGVKELDEIGRRYDEWIERAEESAEAGISAIKKQAKQISEIFKSTQQSLAYLGNVFDSYNEARMEALKRERDYILHSGQLIGAAQKKAIADLEKRELKAQERKIKQERDLFTIKQTLLIAEEIMKAKAYAAEQIRIANLAVQKAQATAQQVALDAASSLGAASMSIGAFVKALGPYGIAAFALSIGGIIASIVAARKKAQAAISALGAPSVGGAGGGGVEAPDFNVVGASPESQLAQSVSTQQQKPLRAFVVYKDIKNAGDFDRNTISGPATFG